MCTVSIAESGPCGKFPAMKVEDTIAGGSSEGVCIEHAERLLMVITDIPTDGRLKGRGAGGGKVSGVARRIWEDDDYEDIEDGDIIVTHMTTPKIVKHIGKIGGIVTSVGGITSHAAIIAREYGVPAVMSVKGAGGIMNGWKLMIDGQTGEVCVNMSE